METRTLKKPFANEHLATQQLQVEQLPTDKISPDPTQPRRTFEEIQEMADSIKGAGRILQPIAIRPFENGYRIIFGERRYQGALLLGWKTIPAIIYNVTDVEALEMQLIENLQREDLHPMQQAQGFKMLIEKRNMDVQEISNRVGKSIYFVRQQLKLNDLIPKWQAIFQKNGISVTIALQICTLPTDAQKELYESKVSKEDEKSNRPYISINSYLFNQYRGDLSTACFDIKDPELDKKMGACMTCPFNSALASLFPEEQKHPRCNNISCFNNKTTIHLNKELHKAMEDPSVVLVYSDYSTPDIAKKLKEEGAEILKVGYGEECKPVRKPEKPEWEIFYKEKKNQNLPERKIKEEFRKEEDTYKFENEVFEKRLATGKYKKAFVVHSNTDREIGKYAYVELTPKITAKGNKKKIEDGNCSIVDIDNEIDRLKQREVRSKELDAVNVQKRIAEAVKADKTAKKLPAKSTSADMMLLYFLAFEHLGYSNKQEVQKVIKTPGIWNAKNIEQFKKAFHSLTKPQLTYLIRMVIIDKYSTQLPDSTGGYAFRIMAESMATIPIADFENEQVEKARKRLQNVNQRIGICQEMKQELLKAQKNATKNKTVTEATPKKVRA